MRLNIFKLISLFLLGYIVFSCGESIDDIHSDYIKGGEKIYIPKPLDVEVKPGNNRVELSWRLTSIQNVDEVVVSYDDTEEVVVSIEDQSDLLKKMIITNLSEGTHFFKLFTRNNKGVRSLVSDQVSTNVLGSNYQSNLVSRSFIGINVSSDGSATVTWGSPLEGTLTSRVSYRNNSGETKTLEVKNEDNTTVIPDFDPKGGLSVVSDYQPDNSIDVFTSNVFKTTSIEVALDKSLFTLANLPMDIPRYDPTVNDAEKDWYHAWDGDNSTVKVFLEGNNPKPAFVTIDLGVKVQLTKFELVGFPWPFITPKEYQIWGIGDDKAISEAATSVDIHDISSLSPEDQADPVKVTAKKAENFEAWKTESENLGWTLLVDDNRADGDKSGFTKPITSDEKIRYVRLVFIDNYHDSNPDIGMSEITFSGLIPTE
ncbi:MAG: DUF4998 domain-containing protein [Carboxylicivirga sp.]|jgi:hypothetical protein|nr:DUF4998 domain-containing protein [Carboxylicivirga sp.]